MKKALFSFIFLTVFGFYALFVRANSTDVIAENTTTSDVGTAATANTATTQSFAPIGPNVSNEDTAETDSGTRNDDANENLPVAVTPAPKSPKQPVVTPIPAPTPTPAPIAAPRNTKYKDGTWTGVSADAYYGNIQVRVTTKNDRITDVAFLDYPRDRNTSVRINSEALPILKSEAISAQSAQVDTVSGATDSSAAFVQSLSSALSQAHV